MLHIGCIYDIETGKRIQLIATDDGQRGLEPHKAAIGEGQAWLDIPWDIYENPMELSGFSNAVDAYLVEVLK